MLHADWIELLVICYLLSAGGNALLAATVSQYHKNKYWGELSHSELRVKQKNADFGQRFNVFVTTLLWGAVNPKVLAATLVLWLLANLAFS
jgi:hypothetical protein